MYRPACACNQAAICLPEEPHLWCAHLSRPLMRVREHSSTPKPVTHKITNTMVLQEIDADYIGRDKLLELLKRKFGSNYSFHVSLDGIGMGGRGLMDVFATAERWPLGRRCPRLHLRGKLCSGLVFVCVMADGDVGRAGLTRRGGDSMRSSVRRRRGS